METLLPNFIPSLERALIYTLSPIYKLLPTEIKLQCLIFVLLPKKIGSVHIQLTQLLNN
jgi:hypothetical protein